jgi:hypothetical protein
MTTDPNTEKIHDQVVKMYKAGERLSDITDKTGVPRPTVYWILQKRGIRPSRTKPMGEEITTSEVLEQLAAANREIGKLQAEIERLKRRK